MAYYDKKSGDIILEHEEKKMFKEMSSNINAKRTPTADNIIKWITINN
jgi:hypothetical protein